MHNCIAMLVLKYTGKEVDPQRYNLPTGSDIAVIILTDSNDVLSTRDVVSYKNATHHPNGKSLMRIDVQHPMYDPLTYVLMFPFGDKGWELEGYHLQNRRHQNSFAMQCYKYRLMVCGEDTFNTIHRMGRLFQQYTVDMYTKIECQCLQYIRNHQG